METTQRIGEGLTFEKVRAAIQAANGQIKENDKRKYPGAMAGVVFSESEKTYALKKGVYVIEPSGDTFNITEPKGDYHPHEW
jgi:hypothetical protein